MKILKNLYRFAQRRLWVLIGILYVILPFSFLFPWLLPFEGIMSLAILVLIWAGAGKGW